MAKCIILGAMYAGEEPAFLAREEGDCLICADAGFRGAKRYGMRPDLVIGDFDSMPRSEAEGERVIQLPVMKDDTDTLVCLREGRKRGYREFRIGGGLGGRMDHTLANIQCAADCAVRGESAWLVDACNRVTVLAPGAYRIPAMQGRKLSLLAFTGKVAGLSVRGTQWELSGAVLEQTYPLGCSNWFCAPAADISFSEGLLCVMLCADTAG